MVTLQTCPSNTVPFFHFTVFVDFCESSPCQNEGMCENSANGFNCLCVAVGGIQYSGVTCEESQFSTQSTGTIHRIKLLCNLYWFLFMK